MKYAIIPVLLISSCSFTQSLGSQLDKIHRATQSITTAALPILDATCRQLAVHCAENDDQYCQPLRKCDEVRGKFANTLIALYSALLLADTAAAIDDVESATKAVAEAVRLMGEMRNHLAEMGIKDV